MTQGVGNIPVRWWTPLVLIGVAPVLGIIVGAVTNLINVTISPFYFEMVMNQLWYTGAPSIRGFAVFEGALEGGALGLAFGLLMSAAVALGTLLRCPLKLALDYLVYAIAIVICLWIIGGFMGLLLAWQAPDLWGTVFFGVPDHESLPRFAWVGGTIYGEYAGVPIGLIAATIALYRRWRQLLNAARPGFPVAVTQQLKSGSSSHPPE